MPTVRYSLGQTQTFKSKPHVAIQSGVGRSMFGGVALTVTESKSMYGGASLVVTQTESMYGGASLASMSYPWYIGNDGVQNENTNVGIFINIPSFPASRTTIVDINAGVSGFWRITLNTDGKIHFEWGMGGNSDDLASAAAITTGGWWWISPWIAGANGTSELRLTDPSGTVTTASHTAGGTQLQTAQAAQLALGVSVSSAYAAWPNSSSWLMTDAIFRNDASLGANPIARPSATPTGASGTAVYTMQQSVGSISTLNDSNATYNMTAGAQGATISPLGPFIS